MKHPRIVTRPAVLLAFAAATLTLSPAAALRAQPAKKAPVWLEFVTGVPLPKTRKVAHPFVAVFDEGGDLHLAWIAGADGRGAIYAARFGQPAGASRNRQPPAAGDLHRGRAWSDSVKLLDLRRACQLVAFRWQSAPHLLETGSGRRYFARFVDDHWEPRPYPIPTNKNPRHPAATEGKDGATVLAWIGDVKRISRTATYGRLYDRAGKVFTRQLGAKGKTKKIKALDVTAQSRASHPSIGTDEAGEIHAVFERKYGRGARANVVHVAAKKPKRATPVSRQPGDGPQLAVLSSREMISVWTDRAGIYGAIFDGRQWNPPHSIIPGAKSPRLTRAGKKRLHLTAAHNGALYYTERLPRGWTKPIDFGSCKGSGLAIEAPNGEVHVIWEHDGTFKHRVRTKTDAAKPGPSQQ